MVCGEVQKFREKHNNDFSNYYDLLEIEKEAEDFLREFYNNEKYGMKKRCGTPIIEIAKIMGFNIYSGRFKHKNIIATTGVSNVLIEQYGNDKIIIISNMITDDEFLYAIAHELSNYIFHCKDDKLGYSNTFYTNAAQTNDELRINRFATILLDR